MSDTPLEAQDWASLNRYRAANAALAAPAAGERRVVFYGNSITDAWAAHFPVMFPGKPYVGRGISGQTTPQMLIRFRQDVVALKPAVVVILAGTNDIAGNTGPATQAMIARRKPHFRRVRPGLPTGKRKCRKSPPATIRPRMIQMR